MGNKITFEGHHCWFSLINYVINTQVGSYLSSLYAIKRIAFYSIEMILRSKGNKVSDERAPHVMEWDDPHNFSFHPISWRFTYTHIKYTF
jgi:hypothetical protein